MRAPAIGMISILFVTGASVVAKEKSPDGPAAVVSTVIKLDKQNTPLFDDGPNGLMMRYFTKGFIAVWGAAIEKNKDEPFMDGDPISGYQGLKSLALKSLSVEMASDTQATVTTKVLVRSEILYTEDIKFVLKRESGSWKIDDIDTAIFGSLHEFLVKSSH